MVPTRQEHRTVTRQPARYRQSLNKAFTINSAILAALFATQRPSGKALQRIEVVNGRLMLTCNAATSIRRRDLASQQHPGTSAMPQARIFGRHDERTLAQMHRCMQVGSVAGGVLCADGHLGYAHPIGGVIAYEDHVSISGVGFDIGCGNLAARLDIKKSEIEDRVGTIARDINRNVSFGLGRANAEKVEHPLFDDEEAWNAAAVQDLKTMARNQLGQGGSGNHYVDLFEDEAGFVSIAVHFGPRGAGAD